MSRLLTTLLALCLTLPAGAATLTLAAASDLATCLEPLNAGFVRLHPDAGIKVSLGSSGNFHAQISQGAPFDLFLSADMNYPRELIRTGMADADTLTPYAVGRLALWTLRTDLDLKVGLAALTGPGIARIAIANPAHAPYGRAAKAALEKAGLWDAVSARIVAGDNVSQAVQFVESGNADAGLIAWSLLQSPRLKDKGRYFLLPLDSHPRLEQGAVVTAHGRDNALAYDYIRYLRSPAARAILDRYGFTLPGTTP